MRLPRKSDSLAKCLETLPQAGYGRYIGSLKDFMEENTPGEKPNRDEDSHFWQLQLLAAPPLDPAPFNRFRVQLYDAAGRPRLADYFRGDPELTIRPEEIRWGGVDRDEIVPIRNPRMIAAGEALYLADTDKVFGIRIGREARAYPRRILGHHEFVADTIDGVRIAGVYCPLCEAMIAYRTRTADGREHEFGTSGFLYRSNKLMYDAGTLSLWNTLTGRPVLGSLTRSGLALEQAPVVTTTWGEWRAANPDTQVLSLLGLPASVNYAEDVAYWMYRMTDRLMFQVPHPDNRLMNKDEVFAPRPAVDSPPVAISTAFLSRNRVFRTKVGEATIVVVTSAGGANRAYRAGDRVFRMAPDDAGVIDQDERLWKVGEHELRSEGRSPLERIPGHRAYWFGWHAAFPQTELIR